MALTVRALKDFLGDYGDHLPVVFFVVKDDGSEEQHEVDSVESMVSIDDQDDPGTLVVSLSSESAPVVNR